VLIAPTQHQPGQAQAVPDGHRTGVWEITKFSGAVRRDRKAQLVENAEALLAALRQARERANHAGAPPVSVGGRPSPSCRASLSGAGHPGGPGTLSRISGNGSRVLCPRA
jgi:hypothetical protein